MPPCTTCWRSVPLVPFSNARRAGWTPSLTRLFSPSQSKSNSKMTLPPRTIGEAYTILAENAGFLVALGVCPGPADEFSATPPNSSLSMAKCAGGGQEGAAFPKDWENAIGKIAVMKAVLGKQSSVCQRRVSAVTGIYPVHTRKSFTHHHIFEFKPCLDLLPWPAPLRGNEHTTAQETRVAGTKATWQIPKVCLQALPQITMRQYCGVCWR